MLSRWLGQAGLPAEVDAVRVEALWLARAPKGLLPCLIRAVRQLGWREPSRRRLEGELRRQQVVGVEDLESVCRVRGDRGSEAERALEDLRPGEGGLAQREWR
eukprot:scaffold96276_cov28-Tisochrysis_lutea.AAC.4